MLLHQWIFQKKPFMVKTEDLLGTTIDQNRGKDQDQGRVEEITTIDLPIEKGPVPPTTSTEEKTQTQDKSRKLIHVKILN